MKFEFEHSEPGLKLKIEEVETPDYVIDKNTKEKLDQCNLCLSARCFGNEHSYGRNGRNINKPGFG